jgi:hypothetical protein
MKHNFKPYLSSIFIETGSCTGDGIQAALKSGFEYVISIEIDNSLYEECQLRFKKDKNVTLYLGDSIDILPNILKDIDVKCTFWLDGHYSGEGTSYGKLQVPLMEELKIIAQHSIKNHTLLLDDMRLLRTHAAEWKDLPYTIQDVEKMIYSINPNYKITYGFGVAPDDILIAQI